MAINKNHEFEELDGVKCAIVERKASAERAAFLKGLLTFNRYTVIVVAVVDPKAATPVPQEVRPDDPVGRGEASPSTPVPTVPATFTVGVTDVSFNPTNAIFGRLLRTRDGHVVTLAYWQQKENVSSDDTPYFGAV